MGCGLAVPSARLARRNSLASVRNAVEPRRPLAVDHRIPGCVAVATLDHQRLTERALVAKPQPDGGRPRRGIQAGSPARDQVTAGLAQLVDHRTQAQLTQRRFSADSARAPTSCAARTASSMVAPRGVPVTIDSTR